MKSIYVIAALILAASAPLDVAAAQKSQVPDPAITCMACHGADGLGVEPDVPHLAGQHREYLLKALGEYRSGARAVEAMHAAVGSLDQGQVEAVAAYFSGLRSFARADEGKQPTPEDEDPFAAVRETTDQCADCHGIDGNIDMPGMPGLAGQHRAYLMAAMQAYKDGARGEGIMELMVEPLSAREVADISLFYAAARPRRAETPLEGDRYAGVGASNECAFCHGRDGNGGNASTPRLAGLDAAYLVQAMVAYDEGVRTHDAMREAISALSEKEIADLAAFYAATEPKALPVHRPLTTAEWVKNCDRCHGPYGNSEDARFPVIAGQSEAYLVKALKHYHLGERPSSMMYAMSFPMSETDIRKLAAHYAACSAGGADGEVKN